MIVLRKLGRKLNLREWKARCKDSLTGLGYGSVDAFVEAVRGR